MVVGESGLGKSTLINSMFLTDVYSGECPGPSARLKKTVNVDTSQVLLQESGVNLSLTIVDTPGEDYIYRSNNIVTIDGALVLNSLPLKIFIFLIHSKSSSVPPGNRRLL